METALIGLCSAIIGGIVALLGMKQRWKEIAENSAQQARDRKFRLAYDAAFTDWREMLDIRKRWAFGNGGVVDEVRVVAPPLMNAIAYYLVMIEEFDKAMAEGRLDEKSVADALGSASRALDVACEITRKPASVKNQDKSTPHAAQTPTKTPR